MQNGGSMLSSLSLTGSDGIVRTSGNQTISGVKTFLQQLIAAYTSSTRNIQLATTGTDSFIDLCSGGNADFDVRIKSTGGSAGSGAGSLNISSGTFNTDTITSNTLSIGGTAKITTTTADNTISNTINTISTTAATGLNKLTATGTSGVNTLFTNGASGSNFLESTGLNGFNGLEASGNNSFNALEASGNNSFNTLLASGANGYNELLALGALGNSLYAVAGINLINSSLSSASIPVVANSIQATGKYGTNLISADGVNGINLIRCPDSSGQNVLQVAGVAKITTTATDTTLNNTNTNIIQVAGYAKITTAATDTTLNNTNANIIQIGGITRIRADTVNTTLTSTAGGGNYLQVGTDFKITMTATDTTLANTNTYITGLNTSGVTKYLYITSAGLLQMGATPSDIRLKDNIQPLNPTEIHLKNLQLEPKSFVWNDAEYGTDDIGLIAQEVKEIYPNLVEKSGRKDYLAIKYDRIPTLLIQSVKELQRQIDELKAENQKLYQTLNSIIEKMPLLTQGESPLPSLD